MFDGDAVWKNECGVGLCHVHTFVLNCECAARADLKNRGGKIQKWMFGVGRPCLDGTKIEHAFGFAPKTTCPASALIRS